MQRFPATAVALVILAAGCARLAAEPAEAGASWSKESVLERSAWECPASPGSEPQLIESTSGPYVAMPSDTRGAAPPILLGSLALDPPKSCEIAYVSSFPVALLADGRETPVLASDGSTIETYYGVRYVLPPHPRVGSPIVIEEQTQGGLSRRLLFGRIGSDGMPQGVEAIFERSESWFLARAAILPDESTLLLLLGGGDWISARAFEFGTGLWRVVAESDVDSGDPLVRQAFIDSIAEGVPSAAHLPPLVGSGWSSGIVLSSDGSVAFWENATADEGETSARLSWVNGQGRTTVLYDEVTAEGVGMIRDAFFGPDGSHIFFEVSAGVDEAGVVYSADLGKGAVTELGRGSLQSVLPDGSGLLVIPFGAEAPALELWRP